MFKESSQLAAQAESELQSASQALIRQSVENAIELLPVELRIAAEPVSVRLPRGSLFWRSLSVARSVLEVLLQEPRVVRLVAPNCRRQERFEFERQDVRIARGFGGHR